MHQVVYSYSTTTINQQGDVQWLICGTLLKLLSRNTVSDILYGTVFVEETRHRKCRCSHTNTFTRAELAFSFRFRAWQWHTLFSEE